MATKINLDNDARGLARNRCCRCDHEWLDRPMGYGRHLHCPRCGSEYWHWLDYEQSDAGTP